MKLYRNHVARGGDESCGYEFFTSKAEAVRAARGYADKAISVAEPIEITPTKAGIISALNKYAGHPDNG